MSWRYISLLIFCFHLWFLEICSYVFDKIWPVPWSKLLHFPDKILVFTCRFYSGYRGYLLGVIFIYVASTIFRASRMFLVYFTDRISFSFPFFASFYIHPMISTTVCTSMSFLAFHCRVVGVPFSTFSTKILSISFVFVMSVLVAFREFRN